MFQNLRYFIRDTAVPLVYRNLLNLMVFGVLLFFFIDSSDLNFKEDAISFTYLSKAFSWFPQIIISALSVAFCVMIIVQFVKPSLRYIIHRRMLSIWLGKDRYYAVEYILSRVNPEYPLRQLQLPIEELVAQIQATAEMILTLNLDNRLYWESEFNFIDLIIADYKFDTRRIYDIPRDRNFEETISQRTIISYKIQRRLEQLQINTRLAYNYGIKLTTLFVSLALTMSSIWAFNKSYVVSGEDAYAVFFIAIISGFLAPVIRDVFAIIEKIRN